MNSPLSPRSAIDTARTASYTRGFFEATAPKSFDSARIVLGVLFDLYKPCSVLDVGCGSGAWLSAAEMLGATKLVGIDGPWVDPRFLLSSTIDFRPGNLEHPFTPAERYDLCMSLEVAEHISTAASSQFVNNLCISSDVIVFSAAIKQQGGVMHVNEQWQSYWARLFEDNGYICYDIFRPRLWHNNRVESWYRQNTFLYVNRSNPLGRLVSLCSIPPAPLDVVHPEIYEGNIALYKRPIEAPTLAFCARMLLRWIKRHLP